MEWQFCVSTGSTRKGDERCLSSPTITPISAPMLSHTNITTPHQHTETLLVRACVSTRLEMRASIMSAITQRAFIVGVQRTGTAPRRGASSAELRGLREFGPLFQFAWTIDRRSLELPRRSNGAKGECLLVFNIPACVHPS